MATSGTYTFSQNRNQIITAAGRKIGAFRAGETPDQQTLLDFSDAMNAMVRHWQGMGIHIWRTVEATLFLQANQVRYGLGTDATDHATETFYETTLSGDEAAGQTTLSATATTNMTAADKIGVVLDDGTLHWSTVSSKTSSTVTIADALASAASSGNAVYTYTTQLVRPLKVLSARRYNYSSALDTPLTPFDRLEYQEMPNKTSASTPNSFFYDRRGGANNTGLLYVWPQPSDVTDALKMTVARPIQDFASAASDQDLPGEWTQALIFNLALTMAPEFSVTPVKFAMLEKMAHQYLQEVSWWEDELVDVQFKPGLR